MANILEILIRLKDEASGKFKALGKSSKDASFDLADFSKAAGNVAAGLGVAAGAALAVGAAFKKTIDDTADYNIKILDLATNLGISTEQTSRLVQTADDYRVSQEQVTAALQMAVRKGFAPTIDTLAQLADEYVAIQSPTERAARMTEVFGKNWTALTPMLKEGGKAIRDNAAAINESLIVTAKAAEQAVKYKKALDTLNDSTAGLKMTIGNEFLPMVAAGAKELGDWADATLRFTQDPSLENYFAMVKAGTSEFVLGYVKAGAEYDKFVKTITKDTPRVITAEQGLALALETTNTELDKAIGFQKSLNGLIENQAAIYDVALGMVNDYGIAATDMKEIQDAIALATGRATQEQLDQRDAIAFLLTQLGLGNIKMETFKDILYKLSTGAYTAEQAVRALEKAIAALKDKKVTITTVYKLVGGPAQASEPGPGVPLPPGPADPNPSPGNPGFGALKGTTTGAGSVSIGNIEINIFTDDPTTAGRSVVNALEEYRAAANAGLGYAG